MEKTKAQSKTDIRAVLEALMKELDEATTEQKPLDEIGEGEK